MPPQPLSKVKPNAAIALGPAALPSRPQLAALVAEIIAFWSEVEFQRGRLLAALLGSSYEAALAMYLALTSGASRRAALNAAAQTKLSNHEYNLFLRMVKYGAPSEQERNDFAHGLWGFSVDIPDGLLLVDYTYRLKDTLRIQEIFSQLRSGLVQLPIGDIRIDQTQVNVYREKDFRRSIKLIERVHQITTAFANLPSSGGSARDQLRFQLSTALPHEKPSSLSAKGEGKRPSPQ